MLVTCYTCDTISEITELKDNQVAHCPQCSSVLRRNMASQHSIVLASSIASVIFLFTSLFFPFISFKYSSFTNSITLYEAFQVLLQLESSLVAGFIFAIIVGIPFIMLSLYIPIYADGLSRISHANKRRLLKLAKWLEPWAMSEIFIIGVLVSAVKLVSMAEIGFGLGFWSFVGFILCYLIVVSHRCTDTMWRKLMVVDCDGQLVTHDRGIDEGLKYCEMCQYSSYGDHCPRCLTKLSLRKKDSLQRVLAWSLTALILYIPANLLPIMHTWSFGNDEPSTIIGGVLLLWNLGSYPIAMIIFIASIVIPLLKLLALFMLCFYASKNNDREDCMKYSKLYHIVEIIGKWSMIDVFVVVLLVTLVQLGTPISILPGTGVLFFACVVISSMLAASSFDPRLIWDRI